MAGRAHLHDMANGVRLGKAHLGKVLGAAEAGLFYKYRYFATDLCSKMAFCGALSRGP